MDHKVSIVKAKVKQFFRVLLAFLGIVKLHNAYDEAVKALNQLYSSRTGKAFGVSSLGGSEEERVTVLYQRIYEEKIWRWFIDVLRGQTVKKKGRCDPKDVCQLQSVDIAEAVVKTAEICLSSPEGEVLRRGIWALEDGSAYYDINTNEKLPYGEEDLFQVISRMDRRFVWDVNSSLPSELDGKHAFIAGQTFDHEDSFWLRPEVKGGSESIFGFEVSELFGLRCLHIQRLRRNVVAALYERRKTIPDAIAHYSTESRTESRQKEVRVIIESYCWGRDRLIKEISDLQPYCPGSYLKSVQAARCCAALLLHENSPKLKLKVCEERKKFSENHPNVLGDTQLIQNALYLSAEVLTKDEGAKQMARYCGLWPVNELLVRV